jgi:hypothetical protein
LATEELFFRHDEVVLAGTGAVLEIEIKTGTSKLLATTSNAWWGAGVATRL